MKNIFITGGTGTVGFNFIKRNYHNYNIFTTARNQEKLHYLKCHFPNVTCFNYGIEQKEQLDNLFHEIHPDIVVHAAALKHVHIAEEQPTQTILVNIIGSLNVLNCCIKNNIDKCIVISTDKACAQSNVYGTTKYLMEKMFLEHKHIIKLGIARFGNIANSTGSVLPFWKDLKAKNLPLKITDPSMNRFMFTIDDAIDIIDKCIEHTSIETGFILTKNMKAVNIGTLAKLISENYEVIGKRPGEKDNEDLISETELPYTEIKDSYILIKEYKTKKETQVIIPLNTKTCELMNENEIRKLIND